MVVLSEGYCRKVLCTKLDIYHFITIIGSILLLVDYIFITIIGSILLLVDYIFITIIGSILLLVDYIFITIIGSILSLIRYLRLHFSKVNLASHFRNYCILGNYFFIRIIPCTKYHYLIFDQQNKFW